MKNRKSNRLKNFDYSQNGMYFVTICTRDREELFGTIKNERMVLNELGKIIKNIWKNLPNHYTNVKLDAFCIMPNHIHLIIEIIDKNFKLNRRGGPCVRPDMKNNQKQKNGQTQGLSLREGNNIGLLSGVIQRLKSKSTVEYINLLKSKNVSGITKIWQRSFYDRIIRNENELNKIREYIQSNPTMWERDRNNDAENIFI